MTSHHTENKETNSADNYKVRDIIISLDRSVHNGMLRLKLRSALHGVKEHFDSVSIYSAVIKINTFKKVHTNSFFETNSFEQIQVSMTVQDGSKYYCQEILF